MVNRQTLAIVGDFGSLSWKIGIPLNLNHGNDGFDSFCSEEEISGEEVDKENLVVKAINSILQNSSLESLPWRDMKEVLSNRFSKFESLVLFKFGQKQALQSFMENVEDLASVALIEIAIAAEISIPEKVLYCGKNRFVVGEEFYPQLLSKEFGNVLLKNECRAAGIINGAGKVCIYNTIHHKKKHIKPYPKIYSETVESEETEKSKEKDLRGIMEKQLSNNLIEVRKILENYHNSCLRLESYVSLNSLINSDKMIDKLIDIGRNELNTGILTLTVDSLNRSVNDRIITNRVLNAKANEILTAFKKITIYSVETEDVFKFIESVIQLTICGLSIPRNGLGKHKLIIGTFSCTFAALSLYKSAINCLFGNICASSSAIYEFGSFGLSNEIFSENGNIHIDQMRNERILKRPISGFRDGFNFDSIEALYYMEWIVEVLNSNSEEILTKDLTTLLNKHLRIVLESLNSDDLQNSGKNTKKYVSLHRYVEIANGKWRKNIFKKSISSQFLQFYKDNQSTTDSLLFAGEKIILCQKIGEEVIVYDRDYFDELKLLKLNASKLTCSLVKGLFDSAEQSDIILLEIITAVMRKAMEYARRWLGVGNLVTLDTDAFVRMVIAKVPTAGIVI